MVSSESTGSWIVLVCLLLAGCAAVGPTHVPPQTSTSAHWSRLEPGTQPEMNPGATGDLSRWWRRLGDPLLSELVAEALQASPELSGAQARLRQARAARLVAGGGLFPEVTASGEAARSRFSEETGSGGTREFYSVGFDAGWELDVFGGVRRSIEAADADFAAAVAGLHDVQTTLAAEVALNYVEARSLQIRLGIARANLASQAETLQLTEWRAQAGLVSRQDVEQARANLEQTRAQIPILEIALAEAEHRLDVLLGKAPGTLHACLAVPAGLPAMPQSIVVGIPADALRRRPDVRAAERALAAETARVGVAEAARYPAFSLSGSIGVEALRADALDRSTAVASSLLGRITAPVFNAGRLRAQVDLRDSVREQALATYERTVLAALQEVEDALVSLTRNDRRRQALAAAAEAANNAAELARQRYSAGLIDFQAVLDTERSVLALEDSLAGTRADRVLALIRLYKALGGGWTPLPHLQADKDTP